MRHLRHRAQHAHHREDKETTHLSRRVHVRAIASPNGLHHEVRHRVAVTRYENLIPKIAFTARREEAYEARERAEREFRCIDSEGSS